MFGFRNWSNGSFTGSVSNSKGDSADIEMDGAGAIHGGRKVWRFRFTNGEVDENEELEMNMDGRKRKARITTDPENNRSGYIELL